MDLWPVMVTLHLRDGLCMSMDTHIHDCTSKLPGTLIKIYCHGCRSNEVIPPSASKILPCKDLSWHQRGGGHLPAMSETLYWRGAALQYLSGTRDTAVLGLTAPRTSPGAQYVRATAKPTASDEKFPLTWEACGLIFVKTVKIFTVAWNLKRNYGKNIFKYYHWMH